MDSLVQLSSITQGVDTIIKNPTYITCKGMWEYYGVYFDVDNANNLISGNAFGSAIVTDDEDASAMLHITPMSNGLSETSWTISEPSRQELTV